MRTLSKDELARASRFHFERDRDRFIVARGELRRVLAGYVGLDPGSLTFRYGARGKPSVEGDSLEFNLSHSGSIALLGLTRQRRIGIDIEEIRYLDDCGELAARFFSKR